MRVAHRLAGVALIAAALGAAAGFQLYQGSVEAARPTQAPGVTRSVDAPDPGSERVDAERLAAIERRLAVLEAGEVLASQQDVAAPAQGTPAESDERRKKPAEQRPVSEATLAGWMDKRLGSGDFDVSETTSAIAEARRSLAKLGGLELDELQCGDRFCRAVIHSESGAEPRAAQLLDLRPFVVASAAMVNPEPDGSVRIYFTRGATSFEELRSAAGKAE